MDFRDREEEAAYRNNLSTNNNNLWNVNRNMNRYSANDQHFPPQDIKTGDVLTSNRSHSNSAEHLAGFQGYSYESNSDLKEFSTSGSELDYDYSYGPTHRLDLYERSENVNWSDASLMDSRVHNIDAYSIKDRTMHGHHTLEDERYHQFQSRMPIKANDSSNSPTFQLGLSAQTPAYHPSSFNNESSFDSHIYTNNMMHVNSTSFQQYQPRQSGTYQENPSHQQFLYQQHHPNAFSLSNNPRSPSMMQHSSYSSNNTTLMTNLRPGMQGYVTGTMSQTNPGTGGSNAQGRNINRILLDVLRSRIIDPTRLSQIVDANIERMDCVNLATLLFHTGKKRLLLTPLFIRRIAARFALLKEELRAREASNALYGLKCMSSESAEVRQLVLALAHKVSMSSSELVAQAVGNALYGCQMMSSDHDEVKFLLQTLAAKILRCTELLEAQNVGNALYGMRGMNSDHKETRILIAALTPKILTTKEDLNGQALGNSLYGLQSMSAKEVEVRSLVAVLAEKVHRCWEDLKAQEVGNALYGLKRMNSDYIEVRMLLEALVPKIASSPEILDAQAIGNSFYGMQNLKSDNPAVLALLNVMAEKVNISHVELDGQAMGNSLYGLQGMRSEHEEVRNVIRAITVKIDASSLEMNAQELGNACYGLQNMTSEFPETRSLLVALARKVASSKHDLTSQEIGNALYGLQGMRSNNWETRLLIRQLAIKIMKSTALLDPQGIANSLYGFQRMSSECEEVRMLVQTLATKIEQSWKLMNAQHVANALFGIQHLSSFEIEVHNLVRALVPKVKSCREDLSSKQLSCALFGIQNLWSQHGDVLALVDALAEKVLLSKDIMSGLQLSSAMFGLQGLDDSSIEVRKLISAFTTKVLAVVGNEKALEMMDIACIANCIYGLQRMSMLSVEAVDLVNALFELIKIIDSREVMFSAPECSNILYGLQNCSFVADSIRGILRITSKHLKNFCDFELDKLTSVVEHSAEKPSLSIDIQSTPFSDLLALYQACTLALISYRDMDADEDLKAQLLQQQAILLYLVEKRKEKDYVKTNISIPELRLTEALKVLLVEEPYMVLSNDLIFGFEFASLIKLRPAIDLKLVNGDKWEPLLNFEILGSSHTNPSKDLFTRLRNRFFYEHKGISVEMIHASAMASSSYGKGHSARKATIDVLRNLDGLRILYPPTVDDATVVASELTKLGYCNGGLMSSIHERSSDELLEYFLANSGHIEMTGFNSNSTYEYMDDNLDVDLHGTFVPANRDVANAERFSKDPKLLRIISQHWIGDHPKLSPTCKSPSSRSRSDSGHFFNFNSVSSVHASRSDGFYSSPTASSTTLTNPVIGKPIANVTSSLVSGSLHPNTSVSSRVVNSSSLFNASFMSSPQSQTNDSETSRSSLGSGSQPSLFMSPEVALQSSANASVNSIASTSNHPNLSDNTTSTSSSINTPVDSTTVTGSVEEENETDTEERIAILETQLEIARMEAQLLKLKKRASKSSVSTSTSVRSGNSDGNASGNTFQQYST